MAGFKPTKIDLTQINNGNRYENGQGVDASSINYSIEASAYAQSLATNTPEYVEDGTTSRVEIVETAQGTPKLVFYNLVGKDYSEEISELKNMDEIFWGIVTQSQPVMEALISKVDYQENQIAFLKSVAEGNNLYSYATVEDKFSVRQTADGLSVVDNSPAIVQKIQGATVVTEQGLKHANIESIISTGRNLFNIKNVIEGSRGSFTVSGNDILFDAQGREGDIFAFGYWLDVEPNTNLIVTLNSKSIKRTFVYVDNFFGTFIANPFVGQSFNTGNNSRVLIGFYSVGSQRDDNLETISNIMINVGNTALPYEPYKSNEFALPQAVELKAFDYILPQENKIVRATKISSTNGEYVVEQLSSAEQTVEALVMPKDYFVYNKGSEKVVQGFYDNSSYGANCTITTKYVVLGVD